MGNIAGPLVGVAILGCLASACGARSALVAEGAAANDAGGAERSDVTGDSGRGGTAGSGPSGGSGGSGGADQRQLKSSKLDLLLVVDNSRSMGEKQALLRASAATLISRLTNPRCVDAQGRPATDQPATSGQSCPAGSTREMAPVTDMHIGMVTSSLGGHGADSCSPQLPTNDPSEDDRGELVTRGAASTYLNRGYLVWDPEQKAAPSGQANAGALAADVAALIAGAGEVGCDFEATLEAWYRFLIDPEPPEGVSVQNGSAVLQGVNQRLLTQRSQFLRPDSAVLIVMLSDENDCSIIDGGISRIAAQAMQGENSFYLPRATSACAGDPNGPCCRSCNAIEDAPPPGCSPTAVDRNCQTPHDQSTDPLNLRCWEQKRRFGFDFLNPIERYVRGLTSPTVPNRSGVMVQNPLFADLSGGGAPPRHPSLISVAGIVGVPWQDLAQDPRDLGELRYMTAAQIGSNDRWLVMIGDPGRERPPRDPLMRESIDPRTGTHPITDEPVQPPTATSALANSINGHEWEPENRADLQFACIFPLLSPIECGSTTGCDCSEYDGPRNKPLCQAPDGSYGTTQYHAQAYPGLRQLELLSKLGKSSIVASICARNPGDRSREDYAYVPAVSAMTERLKDVIE